MKSKKDIKIVQKEPLLSRMIRYKYFYLMLLPVLAYYILFHYIPLYGVTIAFKDFRFADGINGSEWVGAKYFIEMFSDKYFWKVLTNTLIINFFKLLLGFPAPIILALMLNEIRNERYKKLTQTISYMPHFLSWVILSGVILYIFSPSQGPINYIRTVIGMDPVFFMTDKSFFRGMLVGSGIWRTLGFNSIIYLAAIAGISKEMYEAAEIDGATRFRQIFAITLPSLKNVIIIMLILNAGTIINDDFEQVFNLLNAKVMGVGDVLSTYTYRVGLERMNYSYGAAVGLFKNVIALATVLLTNFIAKRFTKDTIF